MQIRVRFLGQGLLRRSATSVHPLPVRRLSWSSMNASPSQSIMLMWWRSAVNLSFFLSLAIRPVCVPVPCTRLPDPASGACFARPAFPLVPALGSTRLRCIRLRRGSLRSRSSALFAGFNSYYGGGPTSRAPCIIGYGSSPSRCGLQYSANAARRHSGVRYETS